MAGGRARVQIMHVTFSWLLLSCLVAPPASHEIIAGTSILIKPRPQFRFSQRDARLLLGGGYSFRLGGGTFNAGWVYEEDDAAAAWMNRIEEDSFNFKSLCVWMTDSWNLFGIFNFDRQ